MLRSQGRLKPKQSPLYQKFETLLGWDLPPQAPTFLSLGVFGFILITVMLFFPHGLLPALLDSLRGRRRTRARRRVG